MIPRAITLLVLLGAGVMSAGCTRPAADDDTPSPATAPAADEFVSNPPPAIPPPANEAAAGDPAPHSHDPPPGADGRQMIMGTPPPAVDDDIVLEPDAPYVGPPFLANPSITRDGGVLVFVQADIPNDQYLWQFDGVRTTDDVMQAFFTIIEPPMIGSAVDEPRMLTMPIPVAEPTPIATLEVWVRLIREVGADGPYRSAAAASLGR